MQLKGALPSASLQTRRYLYYVITCTNKTVKRYSPYAKFIRSNVCTVYFNLFSVRYHSQFASKAKRDTDADLRRVNDAPCTTSFKDSTTHAHISATAFPQSMSLIHESNWTQHDT